MQLFLCCHIWDDEVSTVTDLVSPLVLHLFLEVDQPFHIVFPAENLRLFSRQLLIHFFPRTVTPIVGDASRWVVINMQSLQPAFWKCNLHWLDGSLHIIIAISKLKVSVACRRPIPIPGRRLMVVF